MRLTVMTRSAHCFPDDDHDLSDLLNKVHKLAQDHDRITVGDVQDLVGARGFGPFILLLGLAAMTPLGLAPLLPSLFAVMVLLVAGQLACGCTHLWLPNAIKTRSLPSKQVEAVLKRLDRLVAALDRIFKPRLKVFVTAPFDRILALLCVIAAFTIPPLELVPFGVAAPAGTLILFGLALTARDGLLALLAVAGGIAAIVFAARALWS